MQQSNGKVILVTGGAQGLGKAISATLAQEHTVIIGDVQEDKMVMLARQLQENNGNAYPLRLDVGNEDSVKEVISEIAEKFGRLDALINNAGVDFTKPIMEMTAAEWDLVMTVNLRGPFLTSKYALPVMAKQGGGHIINVVSTASLRAWPEASAYHASKWGLRGFTQALFTEARRHNIKVTAVIAGGMKTPFLLDRFPDIDQTKLQDPENVAGNIKYLLQGPAETAVPEIMVIPLQETSWP
ncbi:SDR family oxidoreductase [Chitinophaga japonensis]|uniref:NADP-dependent 3-hydroxy acid dehydrogenase YdfG n=1 Tax=Chitinophaga japonensis TaxID=104662 RepID=A0A562T0C2_CHIJA|nr:SDR family oxidoreductase [Chitinophaga japonensis]TWI86977.1 NADP-dependent 3-hydroxy acid dehydrogenase YdfG [Chitinophaga japonensis]